MEFPEEIWQLILNHFDSESLKKCLLWSDDFRDLIVTTPRLMQKLQVIFYKQNWRKTVPFVKQNGKFVRSVKFFCCQFKGVEEIEKILRLTPNVEEVICDHYLTNSYDEENVAANYQVDEGNIALENNVEAEGNILTAQKKVQDLPEICELLNLKKLTLVVDNDMNFCYNFIKLLRSSKKINFFKLWINFDEPKPYLGEFLMQQNDLECLHVTGSDLIDSIFTESFIDNYKFKLRSLVLLNGLEFHQRLSRFVLEQSETLQELTLISNNMNFHYFRLVVNNFHSLKKLNISIRSLMNDARVEEIKNLRMPSVTELELAGYCDDVSVFNAMIELFPNLETLTTKISYFSIFGVLEKLPKLRKLSSPNVRLEMLKFAKSDSLKELKLENVNPILEPFFWEKLAEDFPNIERLTIKNIDVALVMTVNIGVRIILKTLKFFKKLRYFELVNDAPGSSYANDDADAPQPEQVFVTPSFQLILEIGGMKPRRLQITNYFSTIQAEVIAKLVEDLRIVETSVVESA